MARLARKASAITNGFPDLDETKAGVGYIRFVTKEGEEKEMFHVHWVKSRVYSGLNRPSINRVSKGWWPFLFRCRW